jgi:hypothetical protein
MNSIHHVKVVLMTSMEKITFFVQVSLVAQPNLQTHVFTWD